MKKIISIFVGALALSLTAISSLAQTASPSLSPNLQEIVKLTQAHLGDSVIIAYIHNSGAAYTLSADDILYLNSQGVSQPVISELLHNSASAPVTPPPQPQPSAPPQTAAPQPPPPTYTSATGVAAPATPPPSQALPLEQPAPDSEINLGYFQSQLTPAGSWVDVPAYGLCWQPRVELENPAWRPYLDNGHWVYTDDGWSWQSDYSWGEIAFHYGRWYRDSRYGWLWRPGYHWGPAWVAWRQADAAGFCGWAPLPPDARYEVGVGLVYHGHVGLDIDFGLAPSAYVFLPFDHFWAHDYRAWAAPEWRRDALFRGSIVFNDYHFVGGHFIIGGLPRERMAIWTHHDIPIERFGIRDVRIARAREFQHLHSAEVRHEIRHDDFVRGSAAIHHDVRAVEAAHHQEAVRRMDHGGAHDDRNGHDDRHDNSHH